MPSVIIQTSFRIVRVFLTAVLWTIVLMWIFNIPVRLAY